jgi:hypothetical protein
LAIAFGVPSFTAWFVWLGLLHHVGGILFWIVNALAMVALAYLWALIMWILIGEPYSKRIRQGSKMGSDE